MPRPAGPPGSVPPGSILPDPSVLDGVSAPPFVHLPDPADVFARRAARFDHLAKGHPLGPYLTFLGALARAQQVAAAAPPAPEPPDADALERARTHAMPPLDRGHFTADAAFDATFDRLLAEAAAIPKPTAAHDALARLAAASPVARGEMVRNVLADSIPVESLAEHLYVAAALQVQFTRLASGLDAESLAPVGDGVCPCCGGPPVASLIVDWPAAHGARYCVCSLCATLWNFVRVRCTACGSTGGIGYQELEGEGAPGAIKAETCDACHSYAKVMYLAQDEGLDPVADDVASLGLDLKQKEGPYRRSAFNPFLLGF